MDDLASTINQIIGSEEGMNQLKTIANALGLNLDNNNSNANFGGGNFSGNSNPPPDNFNNNPQQNNILATLGSLLGGSSQAENSTPTFDPSMLIKLQSAFALMSKEDNNTMLLRALKPHMSEERQKKIDDAIKMMQLVRMLPLIKELGLFGGEDK